MKNIIIVGDSFCASSTGWPGLLAQKLNLNLISHGQGGQPWWNAKKFLDVVDQSTINYAEYMIFVHTNADRIPTSNTKIGLVDHSVNSGTEIENAIQLHYKYIHDAEFLNWAQKQWFRDIGHRWAHKKLVHLHSFPWSLQHADLLTGLNITTNLCSISLNELGAEKLTLFNDQRNNHLNDHNNAELADQLAQLLENFQSESVCLSTDRFDLKTQRWFDWS